MAGLSETRRRLSALLLISGALAGIAASVASCSSRSRDRPTPAASTAPAASELWRRFDALLSLDRASMPMSDVARFATVLAEYERSFGPAARAPLGPLGDEDVEAVFRATALAAAYSPLPVHVETLAALVAELEARGKAEKRHHKHLFQALLAQRKLGEARALRAKHPELELAPVPEIRDVHDGADVAGAQPSVWTVAADATDRAPVLEQRGFDLTREAQVVVIANPFCHFARAAVAALEADPQLLAVFSAHSSWITPQDGFFAVEETQAWNRAHPGMPIAFSVRREEWLAIDTWSTPTFYFLQRGALVAKVEGWPSGGRRHEIVAALQKIGLL